MDGKRIFIVVLLGMISVSRQWTSGSVSEVTVRRGDNFTLYCDCKYSTGVYIVWYKNCSHESPLSLVLKYDGIGSNELMFRPNPLPRFHLSKNESSSSYDLLIPNITDSDEGLYYCGTETTAVVDEEQIFTKFVHTYGNITKIQFKSRAVPVPTPQEGTVCWTLLYSLCPALALLSSLLSSLLVYRLCQKKGKDPETETKEPDSRGQTRKNQDEDVCYAALEIRQTSQRPKRKKKTHTSDFSTYAAINTSRV